MFVQFIGGPHDGDICYVELCETTIEAILRIQASSTRQMHDYRFQEWSNIEVDESCETPRSERCIVCGNDHSGDKERVARYLHQSLWKSGM